MSTNQDHGYVVPPDAPHVRHEPYAPRGEALEEARAFASRMHLRRSVRMFSDAPVGKEVIAECIRAAGSAPSGANKQPWRFVAVSNGEVKAKIRAAAEAEEREFYSARASERWLADLRHIGTDADKRFLTVAPWLVVVFALKQTDDGGQVYYLNESVGLAAGLFLAACHHAGLATLTHTPSPMTFLRTVLGRPENERPFLLVPVGYPTSDCLVPDIRRKPMDEISVWVE